MERRLRKHLPNGEFVGTTETQSKRMSAVRSQNNRSTEARLRLSLVRHGVRGWTMHAKDVEGKPDFYFGDQSLAVFVDGCFWHGCPQCGHYPKSNAAFWRVKIDRNRERDAQTTRRLRAKKIRVLRFWEHELKDDIAGCINRLYQKLKG